LCGVDVAEPETAAAAATAGAVATAEVFQLLTGWVGRGGGLSAGMKSAREKEEGCAVAPAAADPPGLCPPNSERGAGAGEERALMTGDLYAAIEADEETEEPEVERTAANGCDDALARFGRSSGARWAR
jgi:hypothetical protein